MSKIIMQADGTLSVPDVPTVPYITGDGVGAEVTPSMQAVSSGKKCWRENVPLMRQVLGYRRRR